MEKNKKQQQALFHFLLKELRSRPIQNCHILVGVSGGVDSMTLLDILLEMKNLLQLEISVIYVHHASLDKSQRLFQNQAFKLIKKLCLKQKINFLTNLKSPPSEKRDSQNLLANPVIKKPLHSEQDMRQYRYQCFDKYLKKIKASYLFLAHTADDLLETRLLRLIRGTGEQGLQAMSFQKATIVRPFIQVTKAQITAYARSKKLTWYEDPSNHLTETSLRSWIRGSWLPVLEKKLPGSTKTLARSLELLLGKYHTQEKNLHQLYKKLVVNHSLRRDLLMELNTEEQKPLLAFYMRQQGFKNYGLSHIQEIIKRLEQPQKHFHFPLLGRQWSLDSQWLSFKKKPSLAKNGH